jgi:hypothetical protein
MNNHIKVTVWCRQFKQGEPYHFNHIEYGHGHGISPVPKSEQQKAWDSSKWAKRETIMENNEVK